MDPSPSADLGLDAAGPDPDLGAPLAAALLRQRRAGTPHSPPEGSTLGGAESGASAYRSDKSTERYRTSLCALDLNMRSTDDLGKQSPSAAPEGAT